MVELYIADTQALAPFAQAAFDRLGASRRERVRTYRMEADRLRCLAGGLLMIWALGTDEVETGEKGKPCLSGGPEFSLSHSGRYAVLATAQRPVGVDVEAISDRPYRRLLGRLHPEEQAAIRRAADPQEAFFRLWTLKESYVKYLGVGLGLDFRRFWIDVGGDAARLAEPTGGAAVCSVPVFLEYSALPGFALSVCSEDGIRGGARFLPMER